MVMLAEDRATDAPPPITWTAIPVPVQIGVRSNTSDVLMDALVAHRRVCEAADAFRDKRNEVVTFHELALPLVLGREVEWASRDPGKDGSSTTVYTFASGHPGRITKPYGRGMWRPTSIHKQLRRSLVEFSSGRSATSTTAGCRRKTPLRTMLRQGARAARCQPAERRYAVRRLSQAAGKVLRPFG